jgi:hypothetical protein
MGRAAIDACDASRGDRLVLDFRESLPGEKAEISDAALCDPRERDGRCRILQSAEAGKDLRREEIHARGCDLANLEKYRPEPLQQCRNLFADDGAPLGLAFPCSRKEAQQDDQARAGQLSDDGDGPQQAHRRPYCAGASTQLPTTVSVQPPTAAARTFMASGQAISA